MPETTTTLGDVLTLSEAAALLRVEEAPLADSAARGEIPARKIGKEWRFSKTALVQWLHSGQGCQETSRDVPSCCSAEASLIEKLAFLVEQRASDREKKTPRPGSKEAVLKCFGVFAGDGDVEEEIARLAAIRRGDATGVGG